MSLQTFFSETKDILKKVSIVFAHTMKGSEIQKNMTEPNDFHCTEKKKIITLRYFLLCYAEERKNIIQMIHFYSG